MPYCDIIGISEGNYIKISAWKDYEISYDWRFPLHLSAIVFEIGKNYPIVLKCFLKNVTRDITEELEISFDDLNEFEFDEE